MITIAPIFIDEGSESVGIFAADGTRIATLTVGAWEKYHDIDIVLALNARIRVADEGEFLFDKNLSRLGVVNVGIVHEKS